MKIVLVDTTIAGELIGGAQTFLVGLMSGLNAKGHQVHLVAGGVPNERIGAAITGSGATIHNHLWGKSQLVDDAATEFAKWVNELRPDVFVVSVSPDIGWVALPLLDPSIATVNIAHSNERGFYDPLRHYVGFVNCSVGVSLEICDIFRRHCGVENEKVQWIPYGVTPSSVPPAESTADEMLRLVYVGRLAEPDKKVSDLIRLVKQLRNSKIEYSLKVIGDGPMMSEFQKELTLEISTGKVQMFGWLDNAKLLEYLRRSEVSLLVSESEGFCIALVEAMANGCAPVVTDIESGNKQLVEDGVNGFLVPVGDVAAFADRIGFLASDRVSLSGMRRQAWETGREYSVGRMVDNYVRCFEEAVADARENPRVVDPEFPLMESCRSRYPLWLRRMVAKFRS